MAILIGIVVVFMMMFILGVPREIILFCALALMLIFSVFCVVFFFVSLINLLRSKTAESRFIGFMYWDRQSDSDSENKQEYSTEKDKNRVAFAAYELDKQVLRNLFPTDEFMVKLYKPEVDVNIRVCNIGRNRFAIDKVTTIIIFIGLPVFCVITGILIPLIMQYMYIFNV